MDANVLHGSSIPQARPWCIVRVYDKLGFSFFPRGERSAAVADPLTYVGWMRIVLGHNIRTGQVPTVRVQVRKRGVTFCGRVLEAAPGRDACDEDWFKVDCQLGQLWFVGKNVRQCSHLDSLCHCADEARATGGAPARGEAPGACAVPPGNTGTTVGEGS